MALHISKIIKIFINMSSFIISKIFEEVKNFEKKYFDLTQEKRKDAHLHIIPSSIDWRSEYLWRSKNNWKAQAIYNPFHVCYTVNDIVYSNSGNLQEYFKFCIRIKADEYPKEVIGYYTKSILPTSPANIYIYTQIKDLITKCFQDYTQEGIYVSMGFVMQTPMIIPFFNFNPNTSVLDSHQFYTLKTHIDSLCAKIDRLQKEKIENFNQTRYSYLQSRNSITSYLSFLLTDSFYSFIWNKKSNMEYQSETSTLIIDYNLPNKNETPNEVLNTHLDWCKMPSTKEKKLYDLIIYSITLRTLAEICHYDDKKYIQHICFNGKIKDRSPFTGQMEEKYILSVNVSREQIESLNLEFIDPKECFKHLKGVSASKLYEQTEIRPIITPSFNDKRIVKARNIETTQYTNLAEMDWEEFEHLVRQVFEWEFSDQGGEVNVTQSSRDGGVDAIVFDPDPIRGGKIIIQAKRYTNTVPVSAVRDLYGTIINEGANKGILITTSDYGPDSYKFAQGKPITLLNGGHLLYLIEKHGHHARIDINEAKAKFKESK